MTGMVRARLRWLSAAEGGRAAPPTGPRYSTVARFEDAADWPDRAWSIVAEFHGSLDASGTIEVDLSFLAPDNAPAALLHVGSRFELFEGRRLVAKGEVLP